MRWGIIHDYFTEKELNNFWQGKDPECGYISKYRKTFDVNLKMHIAQYTNCTNPVSAHVDAEFEGMPNYMQFLVPISVDRDTTLCHQASTVVEGDELWWRRGSLLWWYSDCTHWSGDYTKTNTSKQAWVIQTGLQV